MITIILLLLILILLISNYYVHYYGQKGRLINLIPGPSGYPIVGNAFQYLVSREKQWKLLVTITDEFYPILKIWLFFLPVISVRHPNDFETILSSTKHIEKSLLYDVIHPWFGTGLLTSGGAKWHSRRKILTPSFHFNILQHFIQILIEEGENMTKSLKNAGGTIVKDLVPFFSEHTLNAICETAMGTSLRGLGDFQQQYREAVHQMGELLIYRVIRQWLRSDWIFSLTSKGREQKKMLKILHGFTKRGHDTTAMGLCYILALLAEHNDIQDRVRNEVNTALQENEQRYTMKLLQNLPYLERCIKEALRLYPSVFFISRIPAEDVKLQTYLVPAGTLLFFNIYAVHRDPNFWSNPELFDPDRFLPEKIRHRHPYSYLPFSAGPRNCIGQRFAMLEMKAMIASLIHNFYLEPIDYLKNLRMQVDLVLRPAKPLRVKFIPVCKTNASFETQISI